MLPVIQYLNNYSKIELGVSLFQTKIQSGLQEMER